MASRNPIHKDLRSPKYRKRVKPSKKVYKRKARTSKEEPGLAFVDPQSRPLSGGHLGPSIRA